MNIFVYIDTYIARFKEVRGVCYGGGGDGGDTLNFPPNIANKKMYIDSAILITLEA